MKYKARIAYGITAVICGIYVLSYFSESAKMSPPIPQKQNLHIDPNNNNNTKTNQLIQYQLDHSLRSVNEFKRTIKNKTPERANAAFVVLARNRELPTMLHTMREIEASFNQAYQYPYVFLNDEDFSDEFKYEISKATKAKVEFGLIPKEHWSIPSWIDEARFKRRLLEMGANGIPYGALESYRHMCRYNSGFFYKHPLMLKYDFYWRIEPDVDYVCKLDYDPFLFMQKTGKKYGFNIVGPEFMATMNGFWETTIRYLFHSKKKFPKMLMPFGDKEYNGIHFW